jgi:hypothetical protein
MKRSLSILAAMLLAATPAAAQHPMHPGVSADSMAAMMNGVWEGPFTTDHGPGGTMSITVAHDSSAVTATMTISAHMDIPPSTLANIKHDGGKITWTQDTGGMQCSGSASHTADGALAGTLDCGHAILSFSLSKNAAPKGK